MSGATPERRSPGMTGGRGTRRENRPGQQRRDRPLRLVRLLRRALARVTVTRAHEFTVEGQPLTDVGGTITVEVVSTQGMIGMMERTAAMVAIEHLPAG